MDTAYPLTPLQTTDALSREPFGLRDPRLALPSRLLEEFVDFGGDTRFGGLAVKDSDKDTLIFVGPPGSGRTTYLRRASLLAVNEPSFHQDERRRVVTTGLDDENVPPMKLIHDVWEWYQPAEVVSRLQTLWRAAALRVLAAHVLFDPRLEYPMAGDAQQHFEERFSDLLNVEHDDHEHESIYGQLISIVERHASPEDLESYLSSPYWDEMENELAAALTLSPPLILYIDAFDQEARHGPAPWLAWEKALFYQVFHLARSDRLNRKFRMVATVSDVTYASVREGSRTGKYLPGTGIRLLRWNQDAAIEFLSAKIRKLNEHWLTRPDLSPVTVESWLGASQIENSRLGRDERIEEYLVSHLRYSPRDIVNLGNVLCEEVEAAKARGEDHVPDSCIRARVEELALSAGREQLGIAAADIAGAELAGRLPHFSEFYRSDEDYEAQAPDASEGMRRLADDIEDIIRAVGTRYFTRAMFDEAVRIRDPEGLFQDIDVLSVLWRNGLVAQWQWTDAGYRPIFFTAGKWDRQNLPPGEQYFVFHRALLDVTGIDPVGSTESSERTLYIAGSAGKASDLAKFLVALVDVASTFEAFVDEDWALGEQRASVVDGGADIRVVQVRLTSPGFWVLGGNGKTLEFIRGLLADRHARRQDREYKEPAEQERLGLENERERIRNVLLAQKAVEQRIQILQQAGKSEEEITAHIDAMLESSDRFLVSADSAVDRETARMLEPGEPPSSFSEGT